MPDSTSKSFGEITFASTNEAQQFLNSVLSAVQHPLIILSNELSVMGANPAFYEHFEVDVQDIVGHRIYDLGNGQWNIPELRHLFEQVLTEDRIVGGFRVDHDFEQLGRRVFLVNASRFHRPDGEISIVLGLRDNTAFEFEREYSEKIVDALRDPFLVLGWDLRVKSANQPFYSKFRVDPSEAEGRLIFELGNGQWDIPRLRELLERILPEESTFDAFEVEHDFEGIGPRAMLLNARRINHLRLILLVIEDVTDKKRAEAQQQVLLRESQHRVKNLLMNVRALSELTVQSATSLENFAESFEGRLQAMGRTQDLLVRDPGDRAQFDQIIRLELEAIGGDEASNFTLQGPALSYRLALLTHLP